MWSIYRNMEATEGPPLACGQQSAGASPFEDNAGKNMGKEQRNTETPCPYIPCNNSPPGKNPTAEPRIESRTP